MAIELTPYEARVIGCLLEKEVTTPEQYPLTLNNLTTAVNQKSSREPILALLEAQVLDTLEQLIVKRLVSALEGFGHRVNKYQHRFCNTEFGSLQLTTQQRAIVCLLLLRGPQTPGELRTRSQRLCEFKDVNEVSLALNAMIDEGYVAQLPREAGKRESRYTQLFSAAPFLLEGHVIKNALIENAASKTPLVYHVSENQRAKQEMETSLSLRVEALEKEVEYLKECLEDLMAEKIKMH